MKAAEEVPQVEDDDDVCVEEDAVILTTYDADKGEILELNFLMDLEKLKGRMLLF